MEKYADFVVDLETLSTKPNAVILSIGVVAFNAHEFDGVDTLKTLFYMLPDIQEQIDAGAHVDWDTIVWWNDQTAMARKEAFRATGRDKRAYIVERLNNFINENAIDRARLWGNGSSFDNVILRNYYNGYPFPTSWWMDRDLRTLKEFNQKAQPPVMTTTPHIAINDAVFEALTIQRCLNGDPDD